MRGAPCQHPLGFPKRIAPKRERAGEKANRCGYYGVVVDEGIAVTTKVESSVEAIRCLQETAGCQINAWDRKRAKLEA